MIARFTWALVFVLTLAIVVLIWKSRGGSSPHEDPAVGAALRACADNPQGAPCQ
jgi:branched-subunit amino acid ABC-type transport system permease component